MKKVSLLKLIKVIICLTYKVDTYLEKILYIKNMRIVLITFHFQIIHQKGLVTEY